MRVIDPGHYYRLNTLDGDDERVFLRFVKRNNPPDKFPGNTDAYPGTTTQEVIRALIDRTKYVQNQVQFPENEVVLQNLRIALFNLEARAAKTHGRFLRNVTLSDIENYPTCPVCGHLEPETHNHERNESAGGIRPAGVPCARPEEGHSELSRMQ